ncbi:MAG: DinB family protein [Candidatus Promineifilaceae bacterium]|jgi:hypothetical protein
MNLPDAESLTQSYAANHWLIGVLIKGLSNEDSLVQPPYEGNCLNWVMGHIIAGRHTAMKLIGAESVWGQQELALYKTGSEPVVRGEQAVPLENLISDLNQTQERIAEALAGMGEAELLQEGETDRGVKPIAEHLSGLHWHETYHVGQLELLRDLAKSVSDT